MKIQTKLLITFAVCFCFAITSICVLQAVTSKKGTEANFIATGKGQLDRVDEQIHTFMEPGYMGVKYLASQETIKNAKGKLTRYTTVDQPITLRYKDLNEYEQQVYNIFAHLKDGNTNFGFIMFGSVEGEFVEAKEGDDLPPKYDPRKRPWYKGAAARESDVGISPPYVSTSGEVVCAITHKVYDSAKKFIGVAGVDYSLLSLTESLKHIRIGETGYLLATGPDGALLVNNNTPQNTISLTDGKIADPALQSIFTQQEGVFSVTINQQERLVITKFLPELGWKIAVVFTRDEVDAVANELLKTTLMVAGIVTILSLAVIALIAKSIVTPITKLVKASGIITEGSYEGSAQKTAELNGLLTIQNRDETSVLASSLQHMVSALRERIAFANQKSQEAEKQTHLAAQGKKETETLLETAEEQNKRLLGIAKELGQVIAALNRSSQSLMHEISQVASRADEQKERSVQVATATEEMSVSVTEVARNTETVAQRAVSAKENATKGSEIVSQVVTEVQQVNALTKALSERLSELGKRVTGIDAILTVITDIADQTNLLALNAAIEAARAGDAGRGFAVVADEVRKLAEKTMQATREVGDTVRAIQAETNEAVHAIGNATTASEKSNDLAKIAGDAIINIVADINSTAEQMHNIANASEQQSEVSAMISSGTEEVSSLAERVSEAMSAAGFLVKDIDSLANNLTTLQGELEKGK